MQSVAVPRLVLRQLQHSQHGGADRGLPDGCCFESPFVFEGRDVPTRPCGPVVCWCPGRFLPGPAPPRWRRFPPVAAEGSRSRGTAGGVPLAAAGWRSGVPRALCPSASQETPFSVRVVGTRQSRGGGQRPMRLSRCSLAAGSVLGRPAGRSACCQQCLSP